MNHKEENIVQQENQNNKVNKKKKLFMKLESILIDENYKNKQELNVINQKLKRKKCQEHYSKNEFNQEVELQQKRQLEIIVEYKLQIRQQNYQKCRKLVEILFEIEEQVYEYLQNHDSNQINEQFTRENNHLFEYGMDLIPYKRFSTYDPIKEMIKIRDLKLQIKNISCIN